MSNYREFESYNDDWNTNYAPTGDADHVCRPVVVDAEGRKNPIVRYTPVVVDAEGRKNPIFRYTPANGSEGYVVKAERVVEHVSRAPVISIVMTDHRYGSPEKEEAFKEYKEYKEYGVKKPYTQLGSAYDRPEKVENFLSKIQTEVSQPPKGTVPYNSNWRTRPISTGHDGNGTIKYDDDKDFIKGSNQKKIYSIPIGEKQNEGYSHISQGTNPDITSNKYNFYDKPNEGPIVPSRPLSRPTTDINDAVEYLTDGIRIVDVRRPTKPGNLGSTHWRNGSNFAAQGPKVDSGEVPKERKVYGADNLEKYYPSETVNPINNSKDYGKTTSFPAISHQPRFTAPPFQPEEENSYAETINSSEAKKKYGKLKPPPVSEVAYARPITSDDLIKKYNGTKVPW